jgi:hypothetical protein
VLVISVIDLPPGPNLGRVAVASPVSEADVARLPAGRVIVQFCSELSDVDHERLGAWAADHDGVHLRAYAGRSPSWTFTRLDFLRHYSRLAGLSLESEGSKPHVDIRGLRHVPASLTDLGLFFRLPKAWDGELFTRLPHLRELFWGSNPTIPAEVAALSGLRRVRLDGPVTSLDPLRGLPEATRLHLARVSVPSLDALRDLPALTYLELVLGGTTNLDALPALPRLTGFECSHVRGLGDLSAVFRSPTLEQVMIGPLGAVTALPDMSTAVRLRSAFLRMANLVDASRLVTAPALDRLRLEMKGPDNLNDLAPLRGLQVPDLQIVLNTRSRSIQARDILQLPGTYWYDH